jgi:broad specificity phosphatase PhoE
LVDADEWLFDPDTPPPMTARLILICHAATAATRAAAFPADEPIEARDAARAAALTRRIGLADRAWSSPALCARQTAAALGLDATAHAALRDCHYGRWSGRNLADVQAVDPHGIGIWLADPEAAPHGGESLAELFDRVAEWLDDRVKGTGRFVAVTHASVIRAAVLHVLDAPARSFWRIDVAPLGMVDLSSDGARWNLRPGDEATAERRLDGAKRES